MVGPSKPVTDPPSYIPTSTTRPSFNPTSSAQPTPSPTSTGGPTLNPISTDLPSYKPTSHPTSPPMPCTAGTNVEIKIMTDKFPLETSWTLAHKCGTGEIIISPKYTAALAMHSTKMCLPSCQSYKFTITDAHGDGLCCKWGQGWYEVIVDGSIVHFGGEFLGSESKLFGSLFAKPKLQQIWARKKIRRSFSAKSTKFLP